MAKFFRLQEPVAESDYAMVWINGDGWAKLGLPGVDCSVCGDVRAGIGDVLPYRLPEALTRDPRLSAGKSVSDTAHRSLRIEIEGALADRYPDAAPLPIFARFPPIAWRVPTRPDGDAFWAIWGGGLIVSARVAAALRSLSATGFNLIAVEDIRCGAASAATDPPIPESGDPYSLLDLATETPEADREFFLLSAVASDRPVSGVSLHSACPGCGHIAVERADGWDRWNDAVWNGADIFDYPTTRYTVVTDRIVELFTGLGVQNVEFRPLAPGDPVHIPFRDRI